MERVIFETRSFKITFFYVHIMHFLVMHINEKIISFIVGCQSCSLLFSYVVQDFSTFSHFVFLGRMKVDRVATLDCFVTIRYNISRMVGPKNAAQLLNTFKAHKSMISCSIAVYTVEIQNSSKTQTVFCFNSLRNFLQALNFFLIFLKS